MSDSESDEEYQEMDQEEDQEEEEEEVEEKPKLKAIRPTKSSSKTAETSTSSAPTKDDYLDLMAKANKQTNRFKKRMDIARAKKLKQKVNFSGIKFC